MPFKKATRNNIKLFMMLYGISGSGKTYTALNLAKNIKEITKDPRDIFLIDSEHGSDLLYADIFDYYQDTVPGYHVNHYLRLIDEALAANAGFIILDSISHLWFKMLEEVGGDMRNWKNVRPLERMFWDKLLSLKQNCHVIATARSKTEWVAGENNRGKLTFEKRGTAPIQNQQVEYEFHVVGQLDENHVLTIEKTRFPLLDHEKLSLPGKEAANKILTAIAVGNKPAAKIDLQQFDQTIKPNQQIAKHAKTNTLINQDTPQELDAILRRFAIIKEETGFDSAKIKQIVTEKTDFTPIPSKLNLEEVTPIRKAVIDVWISEKYSDLLANVNIEDLLTNLAAYLGDDDFDRIDDDTYVFTSIKNELEGLKEIQTKTKLFNQRLEIYAQFLSDSPELEIAATNTIQLDNEIPRILTNWLKDQELIKDAEVIETTTKFEEKFNGLAAKGSIEGDKIMIEETRSIAKTLLPKEGGIEAQPEKPKRKRSAKDTTDK